MRSTVWKRVGTAFLNVDVGLFVLRFVCEICCVEKFRDCYS